MLVASFPRVGRRGGSRWSRYVGVGARFSLVDAWRVGVYSRYVGSLSPPGFVKGKMVLVPRDCIPARNASVDFLACRS